MKITQTVVPALVLLITILGCSKRDYASARVKLPSNASAQNQLISYTQSSAFVADVRALVLKNLPGEIEISVRPFRNTSLVELNAISDSPQIALAAASMMVTVLREYAAKHELGTVTLVTAASARTR